MDDRQAANLWLVRMLEGQMGLVQFLIARGDVDLLTQWLAIQSEIDSDVDTIRTEADNSEARKLFFRSQALMEKFVVERISYESMAAWVAHSADVHHRLSPMDDPVVGFPERVQQQLHLYDSHQRGGTGFVDVLHCGIWRYREERRAAGVPITLKAPCEFCTKSISANARAHGLEPEYVLHTERPQPGCEWSFR